MNPHAHWFSLNTILCYSCFFTFFCNFILLWAHLLWGNDVHFNFFYGCWRSTWWSLQLGMLIWQQLVLYSYCLITSAATAKIVYCQLFLMLLWSDLTTFFYRLCSYTCVSFKLNQKLSVDSLSFLLFVVQNLLFFLLLKRTRWWILYCHDCCMIPFITYSYWLIVLLELYFRLGVLLISGFHFHFGI